MKTLERFSQFVGSTFAYWVILFAVVAFLLPEGFTWIVPFITPLLGIIMFGMGLTLSASDFKGVIKRPFEVFAVVAGQFLIMPLLAFALAKGLQLSPEVAVGVILVGCCPGGTSSNVMTFLAKGDVPLSVTATAVTTVLAPIVTPALILLFASEWIEVSPVSLFISIVNVVIIPIVLGLLVKRFFNRQATASVKVLPLVSAVAIIGIVAAVVSNSQQQIVQTGLAIFGVVMLHNVLGYLIGFAFAKLLRMDLPQSKTASIEIGMQNSGLGAQLATAHFSPLAAVPSAIFSVWHNISGSILANIFAKMGSSEKETAPKQQIS
ncbi:bile acid:sodium symporter family protein [Terribacillus saccharophilus]|uniref:Sodium transporter n=1 Tax=Terribacillus saccharophilus TaxID=361277 RepID=A0ABX4GUK1_9BACI|nr:bile acid:sodium symporter family protein [Terribacillus saccharophilus]PAD34220.1 sodium transporter [Terribacillus saccharophilus]PAD94797.1 sodium transporter [Terribacillus saccharophilus]PAD98546.1 sodium transporter [Terribacillus saccharophilus]